MSPVPSPVSPTRIAVALVTGVVMLALGAFIALRPLWAGPVPLASSRWLDVAFALFFLLRGGMNVRSALRARSRAGAGDDATR